MCIPTIFFVQYRWVKIIPAEDNISGKRAPACEPRCTGVFASHTDWVTGLAVAAGRIMASSSNDGTLKLWDLAAAPNVGNAAAGRGASGSTWAIVGQSGEVEEEMEQENGVDEGGGGMVNGGGMTGGLRNGGEQMRRLTV